MAEKHDTPWALDGNEKSWSLLDAAGRRIALIDKGGKDAATRARLIAQAPAMLEALRYIAKQWPDSSAAKTARAAIAAATGEAP